MKIALLISVLFNLWFAISIIDLEQFRHAAELQLTGVGDSCKIYEETSKAEIYNTDKKYRQVYLCLEDETNRTSPVWDLFYGIGLLK